jgi:hypothetical protein
MLTKRQKLEMLNFQRVKYKPDARQTLLAMSCSPHTPIAKIIQTEGTFKPKSNI